MIVQRIRIEDYTKYINKLLSYYSATWILHWAAKGKDIHEYLDDFLGELRGYTDNLMESLMGISQGKIANSDIKPEIYNNPDPKNLLLTIQEETIKFRETVKCPGIQSIIDDFIGVLDKYNYLFGLCN